MSWVMVMGLFDLMAESGPGPTGPGNENIDEIAVDEDENRDQDGAYNIGTILGFLGPPGSGKPSRKTLMNNLFNEIDCQAGLSEYFEKISKKQNKQIRNYTNHNPVHLGRNEEQVENQYQQHHQDNNPVKKLYFGPANSGFFDQEEEEVAEPDNNLYKWEEVSTL